MAEAGRARQSIPRRGVMSLMKASLRILSDAEREQVHERTLAVLHRVGMRCDTSDGRSILAEAGARVDEADRHRAVPGRPRRALAGAGDQALLARRPPPWLELRSQRGPPHAACRRRCHRASSIARRDSGAWRRTTTGSRQLAFSTPSTKAASTGAPPTPPTMSNRLALSATTLEVFATFSKHVQDSFGTPELAPWLKEILGIVFGGCDPVHATCGRCRS